jgi:membrane protease YdiL (CAAX protease family)
MRKYTSAARMPFWKWILCLLGGLLLFIVLYGLAQVAVDWPESPWLGMAISLVSALLGLLFYAIWTNLTERRPVSELTLKRTWADLGLGLLLGVCYFGIVVGLMALAKCYAISGAQFQPVPQLEALLGFLLVAVFEEIIFRGILFRLIDDRWNTLLALIISALLFGAGHLANPGATLWSTFAIALEAGLLLGAAYKFSGTLWLPIGIHWAWNYVQGNVLGFAVSGKPISDKIFSPVITGPDWITGGVFGAEASVPAVVIGLLLTVILLFARKRDVR